MYDKYDIKKLKKVAGSLFDQDHTDDESEDEYEPPDDNLKRIWFNDAFQKLESMPISEIYENIIYNPQQILIFHV